MTGNNLFGEAQRCLELSVPADKCQAVQHLQGQFAQGQLGMAVPGNLPDLLAPGRPERPLLVDPVNVPRRRLGSAQGRAALIHAIAHIEFNAINLALDAVYRFRDMPEAYYHDWLSVAVDEARHFGLLAERLHELGHEYGDFPGHDGLWEMAVRTAGSCLHRMALVPRVLEARGLDVTPGMMQRLAQAGDDASVALLDIILREEVRHVEIGSYWFNYCCALEGKDAEQTFMALLGEYFVDGLRGPFNLAARRQAGFTQAELAMLTRGQASQG